MADKKDKGSGDNKLAPIIIKKGKKHGEHPHHGGAWKVAYADFVTAMMAFFLLLWLLNVTTDEQKRGLSEFFTENSVSRAQSSGSGAILGGLTLSQGSMPNTTGGVVMGAPSAPSAPETDDNSPDKSMPTADVRDPDPSRQENFDAQDPERRRPKNPGQQTAEEVQRELARKTEEDLKRELARREEEQFKDAEKDLRQAIENMPDLKQLSQNLIIDRTQEGLRIQIVDQARYAMFPTGSANPSEPMKKLMAMVAQIIQRLPNKITVAGHTDATPYAANATYTNWELSTDRANSSRRTLLEGGLAGDRVSRVIGKADREPLIAEQPTDPRNRRISVVLLREAGLAAISPSAGQ